MRRVLLFAAILCRAQTLVIEHANVIDATGAPLKPDSNVTIRDGRILSITTNTAAPEGAIIVDATGKFLIPGLWDMHVHITTPQVQFPLLIANGVTGIREMYSQNSIATMRQYSALPEAPRIAVSGFIDGPQPRLNAANSPDAFAVVDEESARAAVFLLAQRRPDFLKVYSGIPKQAFFALAAQARALRVPFAGHVPEEVSPLDASNAGMRSQEHLNNLLLAASSNEEALRKERVQVMNDPKLSAPVRLRLLAWPQAEGLFDTYDSQKAANLFQTFVSNGTFQTPTLAVLAGFAKPVSKDDPRLPFLPKQWTDAWEPQASPFLSDLSPEDYAQLKRRIGALLDRYKKLAGDMHRAGVQILAGTDTNPVNPVFPGWGLHDELALLVECGLTPLEALQTATLNPARYFGNQKDAGTIEAGKLADLVLLDANPLENIRNTQKINAVILRGRYYSRDDLNALLEKAKAAGQ